MSEPNELGELRNKRARLEEESRSLEQEMTSLDNRMKTLEERIAIEELENSNKAKQEAIAQLNSKIAELEQRLKNMSEVTEKPEPAFEPVPETAEVVVPKEDVTLQVREVQKDEAADEIVSIGMLENPVSVQAETYDDEPVKKSEKRKRKLF
jgi:chromosome segregation ATPase